MLCSTVNAHQKHRFELIQCGYFNLFVVTRTGQRKRKIAKKETEK